MLKSFTAISLDNRSFPSKNDKFFDLGFIFNASKTFVVALGMIGFNKVEIFAICSKDKCKILFIFSLLSFSFHGSSSLIYLFVKKLMLITDCF